MIVMPLPPDVCHRVTCDQRTDGRRYLNGRYCTEHAPKQPDVDPARTAAGLRKAAGLRSRAGQLSPYAVKGGSDIVKERPGGYVSRQRAERIAQGTAERQHR